MKMDYRRDLQHNYLVAEDGEDTENYITRMMTENQVQGLLGCECRRMDQKKLYYYDITSKISLAEKCRYKKRIGSASGCAGTFTGVGAAGGISDTGRSDLSGLELYLSRSGKRSAFVLLSACDGKGTGAGSAGTSGRTASPAGSSGAGRGIGSL